MGAWINPKQLAAVQELSKRWNASVYVDWHKRGIQVSSSRGNNKKVLVSQYGTIIDKAASSAQVPFDS